MKEEKSTITAPGIFDRYKKFTDYAIVFLVILFSCFLIHSGFVIDNINPQIIFAEPIVQTADGLGLVNFNLEISDLKLVSMALKVEYSDDNGQNFYQAQLASVSQNYGDLILDNTQAYQISNIKNIQLPENEKLSLAIVWDSKSANNGHGSLADTYNEALKIRITASYQLAETGDGQKLSKEVIIAPIDQVIIGDGVIIKGDSVNDKAETNNNAPKEKLLTAIKPVILQADLPPIIIQTVYALIYEQPVGSKLAEQIKNQDQPEATEAKNETTGNNIAKQIIIISNSFTLDNLAPQISGWQIADNQLTIVFNEAINTALPLDLTGISIPANDNSEQIFDLTAEPFVWGDDRNLVITINELTAEQQWLLNQNNTLLIKDNSNITDLFGNQLSFGSFDNSVEQFQPGLGNGEEVVVEEEEVIDQQPVVEPEPENDGTISKFFERGGYSCQISPAMQILQPGQSAHYTILLSANQTNAVYNLYYGRKPAELFLDFTKVNGVGSDEIGLNVSLANNIRPGNYRVVIVYEATLPGNRAVNSFCLLNLKVE